MEEIKFRASKSKSKALGEKTEKIKTKKEKPVRQEKKPPKNIHRRAAGPITRVQNTVSIWNALKKVLSEKYNIDSLSIYAVSDKNGRLNYQRIFGTEINTCELEKYCGFDSPVIITNADGFADDKSQRARLIERYGDCTVIAAGTNFETFKSDTESIRTMIRKAYEEVDKLR